MNQQQRAKWEQTRAKGIGRFILLSTALFFSLMLIGTSIFDYFTRINGFRFEDLYLKVPIYLVSGLVFAVVIWIIGEYQYKKGSGTTSLS